MVVERVHPEKYYFVRVATIRTAKGVYKRPVNMLVILLESEKTTSMPQENVHASEMEQA